MLKSGFRMEIVKPGPDSGEVSQTRASCPLLSAISSNYIGIKFLVESIFIQSWIFLTKEQVTTGNQILVAFVTLFSLVSVQFQIPNGIWLIMCVTPLKMHNVWAINSCLKAVVGKRACHLVEMATNSQQMSVTFSGEIKDKFLLIWFCPNINNFILEL